jgi:hypothetical protein
MRPELLQRLIEGVTPDQLRQIAKVVLRLSGYASSRITDGPYDGGTDLRVHSADGAVLPQAIAVSVEQGWEKKLRDDAAKAKRKLSLSQLLYITSRRIPEGSFRAVQRDVKEKLGVTVDRIDQQGIVDIVLDGQALAELLRILEIPLTTGPQPSDPTDRRRDAAYAYAFFSPDVRSFRELVREKSLLAALAHAGGTAKVNNLCSDAARLLGAPVDAAPQFLQDLDRLRRQGQFQGVNGAVTLSPDARATCEALRTLREREEAALRDQLTASLTAAGLHPTSELVSGTLQALGALMLRHIGAPDALDDLYRQTRKLRSELQAHGLAVGARGDAVIQQLIELARASPLGSTLATGTLYRTLTNLHRDALLAALDVRSLALVLDASVAIPMFCTLFRKRVNQRLFVVAHDLYQRARRLGFPLQLPAVWLEEMASHLLEARNYRVFIQARTEDLRLSQNAYVAYFVNERRERGDGDFDDFLASFGLTRELERRAGGDFAGARGALEQFLRRQLARYEISVIETPSHGSALAPVEREWDWARHELGLEPRPPILERHDKHVLAWLATVAAAEPAHAPLIVTWDRLLRRVRPEGVPGGALDPLALSELLAFVGGETGGSSTAEFAGLWLGELEVEKSAQILDALVKLERDDMLDAELVQVAQGFRDQYLAEQRDSTDVSSLEQAWRKFRETTAR